MKNGIGMIERAADVASARKRMRELGEDIGLVASRPSSYWDFMAMERQAEQYLLAVRDWARACERAGVRA